MEELQRDEDLLSAADDLSWQEAKTIATLIGEVPSLFTSTIHFLNIDAKKHPEKISSDSLFNLKRLCKSRSFFCSLFLAHRLYLGNETEPPSSVKEMLQAFTPETLSVLVSLIYLHNRLRKGCSQEAWDEVKTDFLINYELAGVVAQNLPATNLADGLRVAGIRSLGSAMLFGVHKDEYLAYKRRLKRLGKTFDTEYEEMLWNCDHVQIGALLLNLTGQKRSDLEPLVTGMGTTDLEKLLDNKEAYAIAVIIDWMETLRVGEEEPARDHLGEFYPMATNKTYILETSRQLSGGLPISAWPNPDASKEVPQLKFK